MADFIKKQYPVEDNEKVQSKKSTQKVKESICEPSKQLIKNIATIATTLTQKGFIDSNGRLLHRGKPIEGSSIGDLLCIAMREDTISKGVDEFVYSLSTAKIKPSLVLNKVIRKRLRGAKKEKKATNINHGVVFSNIMVKDTDKTENSNIDDVMDSANEEESPVAAKFEDPIIDLHKKRKVTEESTKSKRRKHSLIHLRSPYSLRSSPKKIVSNGWIRTE